jgi:hypothetical protein
MAKKVLSVCGSKDLSGSAAYIQYRFGKPQAIELQYPSERIHPKGLFRYHASGGAKWASYELKFSTGQFSYLVYAFNAAIGDEEAGVLLSKSGEEPKNLKCNVAPWDANLAPIMWLNLPDIPQKERYFDF